MGHFSFPPWYGLFWNCPCTGIAASLLPGASSAFLLRVPVFWVWYRYPAYWFIPLLWCNTSAKKAHCRGFVICGLLQCSLDWPSFSALCLSRDCPFIVTLEVSFATACIMSVDYRILYFFLLGCTHPLVTLWSKDAWEGGVLRPWKMENGFFYHPQACLTRNKF